MFAITYTDVSQYPREVEEIFSHSAEIFYLTQVIFTGSDVEKEEDEGEDDPVEYKIPDEKEQRKQMKERAKNLKHLLKEVNVDLKEAKRKLRKAERKHDQAMCEIQTESIQVLRDQKQSIKDTILKNRSQYRESKKKSAAAESADEGENTQHQHGWYGRITRVILLCSPFKRQ